MRLTKVLALWLLSGCRGGAVSHDNVARDASVSDVASIDAAALVTLKPIPCVPKAANVSLEVHEETPATCWDGRCIQLALAADTATVIKPPGRPPIWLGADVSQTVKLGPKLSATAGRMLTTDGKLAVVGNDVWSVSADKPVPLKPPVGVYDEPAKVVQIAVMGTWLVVTWTSTKCRDPDNWADPYCSRWGQLVDHTGASHGTDLAYYDPGAVGQFDDTLFFVASKMVPGLSLFDIATGTRRWQLASLGVAFKILDVVRVRPGMVALLLRDGFAGYRILHVIASAKHPPELVTIRYLPFCES